MGIPTTGLTLICQMINGEAATAYNNANAFLGVGDSTTAFAATQTDLQAATNKLRKAMDASFPSRSANVLTYEATFGTADANFVWNEVGLFNASTAGTMLDRVVVSLGTKTSSATWVLTFTLTLNAS